MGCPINQNGKVVSIRGRLERTTRALCRSKEKSNLPRTFHVSMTIWLLFLLIMDDSVVTPGEGTREVSGKQGMDRSALFVRNKMSSYPSLMRSVLSDFGLIKE